MVVGGLGLRLICCICCFGLTWDVLCCLISCTFVLVICYFVAFVLFVAGQWFCLFLFACVLV